MSFEKELRKNLIPELLMIINEYAIDYTFYNKLLKELKFKHLVYHQFFKDESFSYHYFTIYNECIQYFKMNGINKVTI